MPSVPEGQIFKATYSGVPVYECIIKDVAVMRRRSDAWLNATQILKVVGLDKSQRTRVLEKEVQKGIHEKVQGGYGKYQGTWIPMEIAIELAEHYRIRELLEPIISFVPSDRSPPPAPKHAIASSGRLKKIGDVDAARAHASSDESSEILGDEHDRGSEGSISPSPSDVSSSSRTPSPIAPNTVKHDAYAATGYADPRHGAMYTPSARLAPPYVSYRDAYAAAPVPHVPHAATYEEMEPQARYAEIILDYFISETTTIPPLLVSPPPDFDPNMSIDEDEHTALHWACAMGRIRVVKLLLTAGADVFRVNSNGQTALMRAAMFSNNYDLRKFPELFELLHRSILNIDRNDRTVFHHVVDLALSRGKPHASRYYLETMVLRLAEYGEQLADILNFQDDEGETPLTMAARARSKRLVRLLLEHGADPKIRNKEGKNAEDYIVEDERFRASPLRPGSAPAPGPSSAPHSSEAGQRAAGRSVGLVSTLLHDLADSYDTELSVLERKLTHAQSLLVQIQSEIADSSRAEASLHAGGALADEAASLAELEERYMRARRTHSHAEAARDWDAVQARARAARPDGRLGDAPQADAVTQALVAAPTAPVHEELTQLLARAHAAADRLVELHTQHRATLRDEGADRTMTMYRRLIAAGCGGISTSEVDAVVGVLRDLLVEGEGARSAPPPATTEAPAPVPV
ncbi:Transcription factor mbp1 (MBF subunit p120) [Malassezia caprae]|uniref:Transcription factor mbp1 (MBF subunit p120) n=1 Tax=Malassezia caprae TaxID=1381934 RepID=A0AAF0E953_9BASI|nr:Transcription factor mbp1 (MBF subunit p120) [Malassezia caprae]